MDYHATVKTSSKCYKNSKFSLATASINCKYLLLKRSSETDMLWHIRFRRSCLYLLHKWTNFYFNLITYKFTSIKKKENLNFVISIDWLQSELIALSHCGPILPKLDIHMTIITFNMTPWHVLQMLIQEKIFATLRKKINVL